jgi:hypothetical protein
MRSTELVAAIEVAGTANANLEAKTRRETLEAEATALEARAGELTAQWRSGPRRKPRRSRAR